LQKKHPVQTRILHEQLGEFDHRLRVVEVRGVDKCGRLVGNCLCHHRVGVTEDVHGEAADEVEVLLAIHVPNTGAFATVQHKGLTPVVLEQVLALFGYPIGHGNPPAAYGRR
jgi:hypothetical protein